MSRVKYRELLLKYIEHVASCEGITFLDGLNEDAASEVRFNGAEVMALRQLEDEYEANLAERNARLDAEFAVRRVAPDEPR